jgi:hypothetical protein
MRQANHDNTHTWQIKHGAQQQNARQSGMKLLPAPAMSNLHIHAQTEHECVGGAQANTGHSQPTQPTQPTRPPQPQAALRSVNVGWGIWVERKQDWNRGGTPTSCGWQTGWRPRCRAPGLGTTSPHSSPCSSCHPRGQPHPLPHSMCSSTRSSTCHSLLAQLKEGGSRHQQCGSLPPGPWPARAPAHAPAAHPLCKLNSRLPRNQPRGSPTTHRTHERNTHKHQSRTSAPVTWWGDLPPKENPPYPRERTYRNIHKAAP